MTVLGKVLLWAAVALAGVIVLGAVMYMRDMNRAYERVRQSGQVLHSPHGDIEYTERGTGRPVLVIHGSGGGYDQGELIAESVLGDGFRSIMPSRFGYLRSTLPDGASWEQQAHAYAFLLDRLDIERAAVVALSHGGPSALLFVLVYPERVSSLTLLSAGVAPVSTPDQAQADEKGDMLTSIFRSDLAYWLVSTLFRGQLMRLIGASDAVVADLTAEQRSLVERVVDYMNPAALRSAGVAFDNAAPLPGQRIAAIAVPTLVIHARDDTLQLFRNAEFAAETIPGADLVAFETGGHIVMIVERDAVREAVLAHISRHASASLR